jgi:hypothetical protein
MTPILTYALTITTGLVVLWIAIWWRCGFLRDIWEVLCG